MKKVSDRAVGSLFRMCGSKLCTTFKSLAPLNQIVCQSLTENKSAITAKIRHS